MDDDELFRINSLHRFVKHSNLVLESHSSCEVPAGCGGAVLEWQNPNQGLPVVVHTHSSKSISATFIDGAKAATSRTRMLHGPHVLAIHLMPPAMRPKKKSLFGRSKTPSWLIVDVQRFSSAPAPETIVQAATRGDDSWRAVTTEPSAEWTSAGFDDSAWATLPLLRLDVSTVDDWYRDTVVALLEAGAIALELPDAEAVWVRKHFILPPVPR